MLDNQFKGREVTIHSARNHVNQAAQTICRPPSCAAVSTMMDESPENVEACDSLASLASELEPAPAYLEAERLRMPAAAPASPETRRRRVSGSFQRREMQYGKHGGGASLIKLLTVKLYSSEFRVSLVGFLVSSGNEEHKRHRGAERPGERHGRTERAWRLLPCFRCFARWSSTTPTGTRMHYVLGIMEPMRRPCGAKRRGHARGLL